MSNKLRSHGKSVVVWVLLAMLVLGLGGFGMTNFGGRTTAIGSVGETEISVNDYARALRDEMNAATAQIGRSFTIAEAKQMGLDRQVQGRMFGQAAVSEAQCEALVLTALDACERYFPAFQFVIWAGKTAEEALQTTMFETEGQA